MRLSVVVLSIALFALCSQVLGHSYVTKPTSRSNQAETVTGCRGPTCYGPCDRPKASITRAPHVAARGDSLKIQWPRNNHAGGFIRLAWAPTDQSDSHTAFDAGVQQISCHEAGGCSPDNANEPNGGDSGPADGSSRACSTSITVPGHLTDGKWTLQWAWFGGAFALGDYYSCVDYQISGGASSSAPAISFKGGDFTYPGQQKCKYFNTDRLHACKDEPCTTAPYSGERSGAPYMTVVSPPATSTPAPTQAPTQAPTKAPTQAPTPAPTNAPSSTPSSAPSGSGSGSSSNCANLSKKSSSAAKITTINTWSKTIQMVVQITVAEAKLANWYLVVDFPSSAGSTSVKQTYNAGRLSCEGTRQAVFKPAASWAQNRDQGDVLNVELQVSYTGSSLSESQIRSGTSVKVYTA